MKRSILLSLLLVFGIGLTNAQDYYLRTHRSGSISFEKKTSDIDSIKLNGITSVFNYGNDYLSIPYTQIDSITFCTESQTASYDIYVTYNGNSVTVVNPLSASGVSITTDGATVNVVYPGEIQDIVYHLSGNTSDGSFSIASNKRFTLSLEGVSITSSTNAAILSSIDKKMTVILANGSSNYLKDCASGSQKAAFYSKGQMVFNGSGSLTVDGMTKHAISSGDWIEIDGGNIVVTSAVSDGLHGDYILLNGGSIQITGTSGDGIDGEAGFVEINDGTVNISVAGADSKGIKCDSIMTINGGNITVNASGNQSKGLKSGQTLTINGGNITVNATGTYVSETTTTGVELSYCTGIKSDADVMVTGGTVTVTCPTANAGGKAISCDGNLTITGGTLDLTALGTCAKYLVSGNTYDSYASACIKSNGNVLVSGGTVNATAGGRAISCDGNYTQNGGEVIASTNAAGFTVIGTGTSCTDGFAASCLKADGNIVFNAGHFSGISSGTGGRGIVADGSFTMGTIGAVDSLLTVGVKTSGAPVNATSGWGSSSNTWNGLPKGLKIEGKLTVNSGQLKSWCAQTSGSTNGEAIESKDSLFINGGYVEANAYDDAINAGVYIEINDGHVWAYSRGNDGIDCNGTRIMVNGGVVICRGTECAVDDNDDNNQGGHLRITNATLIAIGGNMGAIEGTPTLTGQKYLSIGGSGGGPGGGGGSSALTLAQNGVCVKDNSGNEVLTFKMSSISNNNSGFEDPAKRVSGLFITTPSIQSGTYRYYTSPSISGGSNWHGLYSGATVTTSGNGTTTTAH